MIDEDEIKRFINHGKSFRIGARGICIECRCISIREPADYRWRITIPRASVSIDADDISILSDEDFYHLCFSVDAGRTHWSLADLMEYDKLTVIE